MRIMKILLISGTLFLNAQVFNIAKDWNLFGAVGNINNLTHFDNECVGSVFVYQNNAWASYSKGEIQSIGKGMGFWLYGNSDCSIDVYSPTPPAVTAQPTPEQIEQIKQKR